jgi:hypothetical protein
LARAHPRASDWKSGARLVLLRGLMLRREHRRAHRERLLVLGHGASAPIKQEDARTRDQETKQTEK